MKKILKYIVFLILKTFKIFFKKENIIILGTSNYHRYAGSTKYLFEYLSKHADYEVYWLTESNEIMKYLDSLNLKYLTNKKLIYKIYKTLKCKVVIDSGTDFYDPFSLNSSDKNILKLCTMHGSGPKLTVERTYNFKKSLHLIERLNSFNIVSFCTEYARTTIGINQLFLPRKRTKILGVPKYDMLLDSAFVKESFKKKKWTSKIFKKIQSNSKIIYYAPTFRTSSAALPIKNLSNFNEEKFNNFLQKENIYFIYSTHPMSSFSNKLKETDFIKEISSEKYPLFDNLELMTEVDMLIGDYSTLATDFSMLSKPQIFIMPDYDEVAKTKGFAEDLRSILPGKEVNNFDDLCASINKYIENREDFSKDFKKNIKELQDKYINLSLLNSRQLFLNFISNNIK